MSGKDGSGMDKLALGLACVALGLVGCGKTDHDGKPEDPDEPVVSGDASKPLADLSDDEKVEVCESISDRYEDAEAYGRGICILAAVESSDDLQSCDAAVDDCVADVEFEPANVTECLETLNFADCDASMRDLSDCLADQRKIADKVSELRSCEDAEREGASAAWFDDVPGCERLLDRCPEPFQRQPVDDSDVSGSAKDSPYFIEGNVDGKAVELRPGGSLFTSQGSSGEEWTLGIGFGRAEVWLWGEAEGEPGRGLLRMPLPKGAQDVSWLCLEEVEVGEGTEAKTWKSSKLSTLPLCAEGERRPLELNFEGDSTVSGTFQGEPVAWVNTGYECDQTCRFEFDAANAARSGRDTWILELDTSLERGVFKAFEHATLIHPNGTAAMACGGGGVATHGEDNVIHIVVDALAPLSTCPGTPVDGELSGAL